MNIRFTCLIGLGFLVFSCKTIQPPVPQVVVGTYSPPVQEVSRINIPIEMELKSHFKAADESVPYQFKGKQEQCDDVSFSYTFDRKPIKIEGKGDRSDPILIGFEIEGKYALNLNYCASCTDLFGSAPTCITPRIYASCGVGEPMRRIRIEYATEVDLKPDFKLEATTKLLKVDPKDKCEITVFKYDATGQLVQEVKKALKELGKEIDKSIEEIEIRKQAEEIWLSFSKPFPIENYGYLYIKPEKMGVNELKVTGSKLSFFLEVEAFPKVSLRKEQAGSKALPNLSSIKSNDGFNINLDLIAPYDSLSALVNRELSGKVIEIKKQKIILQDARIYGAQDKKLSIEVNFSGSKTGKMFFVGTPKFNDSLQEITFPDLSFELETKNALLKSAKWLFNTKITDLIRQKATFNLTPILSDASKKIEAQMNRKLDENIHLNGKMQQVRVKSIFPDQNQLIIQTNLQGNLNVKIK